MDKISKEIRSKNMAAIKGKDTLPEMIVRRLLHSSGYRYRLHKKDLPGKPDLFLKSRNTIIFVHGCFWHQHPNCKYATRPKTNMKFWLAKLERNVERDSENFKKLKKLGYKIVTVWECETKNTDKLLIKLKRVLNGKNR